MTVSVYSPSTPELGKNANPRRVAALRALNEAFGAGAGPQFRRYDRSGARPTYQVETERDGHPETRSLNTREVPAYVLGAADTYPGIRAHVQECLDAALADPDVTDREGLLRAVLEKLDARCGSRLATAAGYFTGDGTPLSVAAV
jgi:hypothetical protein